MKEEKPKLALNKRTIACLNNLEMRHVRGGDGDETIISRGACTETDKRDEPDGDTKQEPPTIIKSLTTLFLTKLAC